MKTATTLLPPPNIDMVKAAARHVIPGEVDILELATAENRLDVVRDIVNGLLPVEQASAVEIARERVDLVHKVAMLSTQKRIHEFSEGEWLLLDPAPFKWRNHQPLPSFGVFSLVQPATGFHFHAHRERGEPAVLTWKTVIRYPKPIEECFADIIATGEDKLREELGKLHVWDIYDVDLRLETKFSGLIPNDVKVDIRNACTSTLFKSLFLVAEVEEWQWQKTVVSRPGDPLIVGYDGFQLWLIRSFDTTTLEKVMAQKFAYKP